MSLRSNSAHFSLVTERQFYFCNKKYFEIFCDTLYVYFVYLVVLFVELLLLHPPAETTEAIKEVKRQDRLGLVD